MKEAGTFKCGHTNEVPPNMGRGQARAKRVAVYFNRLCPSCIVNHLFKIASDLTAFAYDENGHMVKKADGKWLTRRYTLEEQEAYVAEKSLKLQY